ncbi:nucleic acid-binding domain protein [Opisthorchis viverrini]|uniref:Nucleic acid-binding domain protein n=1 Tax=Opisthorchis viverrini TaxID=6198 RepID=A0A1S8WXG7_OPIVI|nr:nucleic acid-binding domain protein [Opisthorchis viverrini]
MVDPKEQSCFLKDLKPNMKRVNCIFIVLELGAVTRTKDGNEVRTVKVADRTGTINLSVWNENCSLIAPCDVIQLMQGNTTVRGGCLTLNVGRYGQLLKMGELPCGLCISWDYCFVSPRILDHLRSFTNHADFK